jgi:hypothetical protein
VGLPGVVVEHLGEGLRVGECWLVLAVSTPLWAMLDGGGDRGAGEVVEHGECSLICVLQRSTSSGS